MSDSDHLALTKLLQLASPALPVGAYSYSQGLESAIASAVVRDAASAQSWIEDVLRLSIATMDAPLFLRLCAAWSADDPQAAEHWNALFLASRESAELRAETVQMGYSLVRLMDELSEAHPFAPWEEVSFPAAFTCCAMRWKIEPQRALVGYLWSWAENQVMAAVKAIPLGQSAGQRVLVALGSVVAAHAAQAQGIADDAMGNLAPGLALLCAQHETQYSRIFRS